MTITFTLPKCIIIFHEHVLYGLQGDSAFLDAFSPIKFLCMVVYQGLQAVPIRCVKTCFTISDG